MKPILQIVLRTMCFVTVLTLLSHCSSTQITKSGPPANTDVVTNDQDKETNITLENMLRKVPGVMVSGDGAGAAVNIRGLISINTPSTPLFVIDGDPIGNDFAAIHASIDPVMVKGIRVLKGSEATLYGSRAAAGVIEISLKK